MTLGVLEFDLDLCGQLIDRLFLVGELFGISNSTKKCGVPDGKRGRELRDKLLNFLK